jgi:hypothetical protein
MLDYFQETLDKMSALKNFDMIIKVSIDLIENLKQKISEISDPTHKIAYVNRVNTCLNFGKSLCKDAN